MVDVGFNPRVSTSKKTRRVATLDGRADTNRHSSDCDFISDNHDAKTANDDCEAHLKTPLANPLKDFFDGKNG